MLHDGKEDMSYRYLSYCATTLKISVHVTFMFLNGNYILLLHILVADIEAFSKRYLFVTFS